MKNVLKKTAALFMSAAMAASFTAIPAAGANYGWQGLPGSSAYLGGDNKYVTGIVTIDGIAYSFGSNGSCLGTYTGFGAKDGSTRYYDKGVIFNKGWLHLASGDYYCYENGSFATGDVTIGGKRYRFGDNGRLINNMQLGGTVSDNTVPDTSPMTPSVPSTPAVPSTPSTPSAPSTPAVQTGIFLSTSKDSVYTHSGDSITFTASVSGIDSAVAVTDNFALHMYKNGSWVLVEPSSKTAIINSETYYIGNVNGLYNSAHSVVFSPDTYSEKPLGSGKYRAVFNMMTESGVVRRVCEFEVINPAVAMTPDSVYYLESTSRISFSTALNADSMVYAPEIFELHYYDPSSLRWIKAMPSAGYYTEADPVPAKAGSIVNSYLDLTRYSRASMKAGKYRVYLTDTVSCEFELKHAFTAEVSQRTTESRRKKQVLITVTNYKDTQIKMEGYGELWRMEKGKWKKLSLKKGAKLTDTMEIPPKYKWSKSFTLTDYYSLSDLKAGSYCMSVKCSDGSFVYAYFDLT